MDIDGETRKDYNYSKVRARKNCYIYIRYVAIFSSPY